MDHRDEGINLHDATLTTVETISLANNMDRPGRYARGGRTTPP
jgi:hypothetical protein